MNTARRSHLRSLVCSDLDAMPSIRPNAVLYFVIAEYKGARYIPERDLCDMTREITLRDLRSGELTDVVSIIETEITAAGALSSRDVTAALLMEADLLHGLAPDPIDRQAARFDHARDMRKHWSA